MRGGPRLAAGRQERALPGDMHGSGSQRLLSKAGGRIENGPNARFVAILVTLLLGVALYAYWCESVRNAWVSELLIGDTRALGVVHPIMPALPSPSTVPEAGCPERSDILAVACSTNEPLHRILQWMRYHQLIGFSVFYFFVEGSAQDPAVVDVLRSLVGVKVFMQDEKLAWWHRQSRAYHENWLQKFFGQPCNGELFVKQSLNMEVAIHQARVDGVHWIGHIDTDELVHPASSNSYSMHDILQSIPATAHAIILPNYEALPEHDHVINPSVEVSLFKVAVDHVDKATMQQNYKHIAHGNPNYFIAYSNGKSLARVQPGLRPHGAHRWASYNGTFQAYTHEQAAVLHYTYNRLRDLIARRDRCECAPTAADVKRCFWLGFDQQAFVAAALKTDEQLRTMFNERLVWDDAKLIAQMRMRGLVQRIYAPSLMIRQLPENALGSVAWRSREKREEDVRIRASGAKVRRFAYATPGTVDTCADFLREDSSLNVLELMGDIPVDGSESKRDSDAVLQVRMHEYQVAQAAEQTAQTSG